MSGIPYDGKVDRGSSSFRNIQLTVFISGLSVFAQLYLFQPLLPTVARTFGTSVGGSSLLVSSSTLGMALGLLFFVFTADCFSRKKQMLFALACSAALTTVSAWVYSLPMLVAIGIAKGFVIAGVSSVALAYLTEEVKATAIGLAISMYLNGNTIGGMSGRIAASLLENEVGWRQTVLVVGLVSLALSFVFWKFFPSSRHFTPRKTDFGSMLSQMQKFVSDTYLLRLYCVGFLLMGTFVSIYNYLGFRLGKPPFSLNQVFIAFIFMMYVFGILGTTIVGRLSEKLAPRRLLVGSVLLMIAGTVCLLSDKLSFTLLGLGLVTLSFFAAHTMASRMVAMHVTSGTSSATSLYWLFYYLGSAVLGSGTGYFLHATGWKSFVWMLSACVTTAVLLSIKKKKNRI